MDPTENRFDCPCYACNPAEDRCACQYEGHDLEAAGVWFGDGEIAHTAHGSEGCTIVVQDLSEQRSAQLLASWSRAGVLATTTREQYCAAAWQVIGTVAEPAQRRRAREAFNRKELSREMRGDYERDELSMEVD